MDNFILDIPAGINKAIFSILLWKSSTFLKREQDITITEKYYSHNC